MSVCVQTCLKRRVSEIDLIFEPYSTQKAHRSTVYMSFQSLIFDFLFFSSHLDFIFKFVIPLGTIGKIRGDFSSNELGILAKPPRKGC